MGETLNYALDRLLGTICIGGYLVADGDDSSPVFRGKVLVGRLSYRRGNRKLEFLTGIQTPATNAGSWGIHTYRRPRRMDQPLLHETWWRAVDFEGRRRI